MPNSLRNHGRRSLRDDALRIWQTGVGAVRSETLIREHFAIDGDWLCIGDDAVELKEIGRLVVVGAGKAGSGMAAAVEDILGPAIMERLNVTGWINVPAGTERQLSRIHLHPARPAGLNEPTAEGVAGTERILALVGSLTPRDVCLCLLSGGGSALMPLPVEGISLADKQAVTQTLSAAGANIRQLNTVRKQLSRVKGGGLARACTAGRLDTLFISDVLGDPLDVIASGPTVPDPATPADALAVLEEFGGRASFPAAVFEYLAKKSIGVASAATCRVTNLVVGNNAAAVDATGLEAERLGYRQAMHAATELEGLADDVGRRHAKLAVDLLDPASPNCLITGGEPTVRLVESSRRGKGGRNQQLVLAALDELLCDPNVTPDMLARICILSGGTDGEDGPTDAAGAFFDVQVIARAKELHLDPKDYLARNDAYSFFDATGGLIRTGPTHTNVCDVRVIVVDRD